MKLKDLEYPFWFDDKRAGATREQINLFEDECQIRLPEEFRQALMARDGGVSSFSSYRTCEQNVPIPSFFSVDELRKAFQNRSHFGTPLGVIVIASGGHEWLGLDYRHGPSPKIVFQESEDSPVETVADSFDLWLEGLREE